MAEAREHSFEGTCLEFLPDCYAFALSLTRRSHDAEDLVQDTFVKAQRAFASFQPGTNAKAWLFTILRRLHIDRFRRERLRPTPLPQDELVEMARGAGDVPAEPEPLPWDALPPGALEDAVNEIPDPFRLPVRLRDLDGFAYKEIGAILNIPAGTVMSRLHRGREYLRRALVRLAEPDRGEAAGTEEGPRD
ncbi:MAG: sigma-70 family RNA polymerase sigma factor [Planctomycetota bacterium]|nr:sigma-70 family RNA polymerase sigma factor [Planctomycetota bacterium]